MIERYEAPLDKRLVRQLCQLWHDTFQDDYISIGRVLRGSELDKNLDVVYVVCDGGQIVATCHITISRSDPRIGGLGEVVTVPNRRGRGLATALCRQAAEEFDRAGGKALFLGTSNPAAAKVYQRLGWEYLPNTNVMLRAESRNFMEQYYRCGAGQRITIVSGDSGQRVTMIPLIVAEHDGVVLDANTGIFAATARHQKSCMSLYARYESLATEGHWFAAIRPDGAVAGLSSARRRDQRTVQIDAFSQSTATMDVATGLLRRAADWAASQPGTVGQAVCADGDKWKHELFTELNLQPTGRRRVLADGQIEGDVYEVIK